MHGEQLAAKQAGRRHQAAHGCAGNQGLLVMELMRRGDLSSLMSAQMPDKSGRLLGWYNRGRRIALQVRFLR